MSTKYTAIVELEIHCEVTVEVEAASEDEAMKIALQKAKENFINDWDSMDVEDCEIQYIAESEDFWEN